jgi:DNA-binding transcriptional LysR family regulator
LPADWLSFFQSKYWQEAGIPSRITLRQLEYFVAVGEEGSIARAAEKVNVSSPSISTAIAGIEDAFGLQLFARKHAHGLKLSQAGRTFMEQARAVLAEAEKLNLIAREMTGRVQGPLNVGCLLTFAQVVMPHLRRGFCTRFPDVQFHQLERDQEGVLQGLRDAELDMALSYALSIPDDIVFEPLFELPPYVLMAADHPLAGRESVWLAELEAHPMVLLDLPHSSAYFLSLFAGAGISPMITERTRDMEVMRSLVANGFGYAIINIRYANTFSADGKPLRHVAIRDALPPLQLGLLTSADARPTVTVRAFADHCREHMTPQTHPGLKT